MFFFFPAELPGSHFVFSFVGFTFIADAGFGSKSRSIIPTDCCLTWRSDICVVRPPPPMVFFPHQNINKSALQRIRKYPLGLELQPWHGRHPGATPPGVASRSGRSPEGPTLSRAVQHRCRCSQGSHLSVVCSFPQCNCSVLFAVLLTTTMTQTFEPGGKHCTRTSSFSRTFPRKSDFSIVYFFA